MTEVGAVSFRVQLDLGNIRQQVAQLNQRLQRETVRIPVELDSRNIKREVSRLSQDIKKERVIIPVGIEINKQAVTRLQQQVSSVKGATVQLDTNVNVQPILRANEALGQTRKSAGEANGALQGLAAGAAFFALEKGLDLLQSGVRLVVGTLGEALSEFKSFEQSLASFDAKSQGTGVVLEDVANKIKEVAVATSFTPAQLADTATQLVSLGVNATDVEGRLSAIAQTADVLGEDPVITGRVFQGALEQYAKFGVSADEVADTLVQLINTSAIGSRSGLAEFEQLFSRTAPAAASLGVDIQTLSAAFAGLRQTGATAQVSASTLDTVLTRLVTRSEALTDEGIELAFEDNGALDLENTLINVRERIQDLSATQQVDFLSGIFGESRGTDVLALINSLDGAFGAALESARNSQGALKSAFEIVSEAIKFQGGILSGQLTTSLTVLGQAIAPVELGFIKLGRGIFDAASVDLSPLTQSSNQLGTALGGNPDLIDQLAEALSGLAQDGVDAFARVLDAITALTTNQDAVDAFTGAISGFGESLTKLGDFTSFLIALADGLATVITTASQIPVLGTALKTFFDGGLLSPIRAIAAAANELGGLFLKLGERIAEGISGVPGIGPIFDATFGRALKVIEGLNERLLNLRDRLFGVREEFESLEGAASSGAATGLAGAASAIAGFSAELEAAGGAEVEAPNFAGNQGDTPPLIEQLEQLKTDQDSLLNEIELRAVQANTLLTAQNADEGTVAARERQTLEERLAARDSFLNELKARVDDESLLVKQREEIESQILEVEKAVAADRLALAQALRQDRIKQAQEAAEGITKALEAERAAQQEVAQEAFRIETQSIQDNNAEQVANAQKETEREIAALKEATELRINEIKKQGEDEIQADQEAFAQDQENRSKAFQKEQQDAAKAFEKELQAERDRGNAEFSRLDTEVDRRLQLSQAEDPEARRELEDQFKAEDEAVRERARIEQQVLGQRDSIVGQADSQGLLELSPLEQARADFEEELNQKSLTFQEEQNAQQLAFEEILEAEKLAFEDEIEARKLATEETIKALQLANEEEIAALKEQSERDILALKRAQEDELREREKAFRAEQRALDEASAERIQSILARAAQGVAPTQSLRSGGVVEGPAGGRVPAQLHSDEFVFTPVGTRVVSQAESRRLVREHLARTMPGMAMGATDLRLPSIPSGAMASIGGGNLAAMIWQSGRDVVKAVDELGNDIMMLASSPRNLSVSSPDPVADMASILQSIAKRQRAIAGGTY